MPTRLLDGPAAGHSLDLRRSPYFLRVVIDPDGRVDALDQLDDTARSGEQIYVYRLARSAGRGFVCSRGRGCRQVQFAEYVWHHSSGACPADAVLRDNESWAQWATAEYGRVRPLVGECDG